MKAIIFNSGLGSRMAGLTKNNPKCMVKLYNGETIFERQIRILSDCGIKDFIVTTGPFKEQLYEAANKFKNLHFQFVANDDYKNNNYIVSMNNANEYLDDDVLLLHGDLVFNKTLIIKLLENQNKTVCIYNEEKSLPEKDFKGRFKDNKLLEVSIDIFDDDCYAFQPLYKLDKKDLYLWKEKVAEFVENGNVKVYAENALNEVTNQISIYGMSYKDDYIEEIDNEDDYIRVSNEIKFFDAKEKVNNEVEKMKKEKYLEFAKKIAQYAGKVMLKYFNSDNGASYKGDKTIVTLADKEINTYLIKRVKETFPTHSVDGEEEQFGKSDYVWVCDPVDGTAMYARHIPVAVFSLALVINGVSEVGVVYDVFTDNLYTAIKGKGAYKNGDKIEVNNFELDDIRSVSNFDMWPASSYNIYDTIKQLGKKTYFVSVGSVIRACMCVASGEFNLAIFPGTTRKNCDIAAAKVIVEEAGGKVTNFFGEEQRYDTDIKGAVISNGKVHDEVIEVINKFC